MAVDRHAVARVLYTNGEIFQVNPQNAACTATSYVAGQQGWQVFGMGYVSDAPGAKTDTLYLGRALINGNTDLALGKIDSNLMLSRVGGFTGISTSPEMSAPPPPSYTATSQATRPTTTSSRSSTAPPPRLPRPIS